MKAVNLLPSEYRPRRSVGALAGSSYFVVGGLLAVLLLAGIYILTANKVTSRENETAEALQQTKAAEAKIAALGPYGDFATVAEQRNSSVKQLAAGRFDWERLTRELANVLPNDVWLTEVDASVVPESAGATPDQAAPTGPSAKLSGCAKNQPDVAKFMVRLRQMNRVTDVQLKESTKSADGSSSSSAGSDSTVSSEGCGKAYSFELTTLFEEPEPVTAPKSGSGSARVPARLGGGE